MGIADVKTAARVMIRVCMWLLRDTIDAMRMVKQFGKKITIVLHLLVIICDWVVSPVLVTTLKAKTCYLSINGTFAKI